MFTEFLFSVTFTEAFLGALLFAITSLADIFTLTDWFLTLPDLVEIRLNKQF